MEPDYTDTHHCRLEVTEEPNTPDILKKLHTSPPRKPSVYVFLRTWKQKLPKNKTKKNITHWAILTTSLLLLRARKRRTLRRLYACDVCVVRPQERNRTTKQRAGNRHVKKTKKHTHTHVLTVNTPTKLEHIKWFIRSDSGHKMFINCRQTAVLVGQQLTVSQTAPYYYW